MKDEDIVSRVERFERTVATCVSVVPILFSGQCLLMSIGAPVFSAMFADFGAKLPPVTQFVLRTWVLWAVIAICVPIVTLVIARKAKPGFSVVFSTIAGLAMFVVAQLIVGSLFLPIIQLGAVASGR